MTDHSFLCVPHSLVEYAGGRPMTEDGEHAEMNNLEVFFGKHMHSHFVCSSRYKYHSAGEHKMQLVAAKLQIVF